MDSIKIQLNDDYQISGDDFQISRGESKDNKLILTFHAKNNIKDLVKSGLIVAEERMVIQSGEVFATFEHPHLVRIEIKTKDNNLPDLLLSDGAEAYGNRLASHLTYLIENKLARQLEGAEHDIRRAAQYIQPPTFKRSRSRSPS